jgi:hypothetical protein
VFVDTTSTYFELDVPMSSPTSKTRSMTTG